MGKGDEGTDAGRARRRAYYAANAERERARSRERGRRLREADPEGEAAKIREYRAQNPERAAKWSRKRFLKQTYGITPAEYDAMVLAQGGRCALCEEIPSRLVIDHDHATGRVRALLCDGCNIFVALYEDRVEMLGKIEKYVADYQEGTA